MSERISWSINVQVAGGPKLSLARSVEVQAYDRVLAEIPYSVSVTVDVEVQPASDASQVKCLLLTSDRYDPKLTFDVSDDTGSVEAASDVALDQPLLLCGEGAIGLLGVAPKKLIFKNEMASEETANVTIIVGRMTAPATP